MIERTSLTSRRDTMNGYMSRAARRCTTRKMRRELNWDPGGVRSGTEVRRSGLSQESSASSGVWEAALCRLSTAPRALR